MLIFINTKSKYASVGLLTIPSDFGTEFLKRPKIVQSVFAQITEILEVTYKARLRAVKRHGASSQ